MPAQSNFNYIQAVTYTLLANQRTPGVDNSARGEMSLANLQRIYDGCEDEWDDVTDSMTLREVLNQEAKTLGDAFQVENVNGQIYCSMSFPNEARPRRVSLDAVRREAEYGLISAEQNGKLNLMDNYYGEITPKIMQQQTTARDVDLALYQMQNDWANAMNGNSQAQRRFGYAMRFMAEARSTTKAMNEDFSVPYAAMVRDAQGKEPLQQISVKSSPTKNLKQSLSSGYAELLASRFDQANLDPRFINFMYSQDLIPAGSGYDNPVVQAAFQNNGKVNPEMIREDIRMAQQREIAKGKESPKNASARATAAKMASYEAIFGKNGDYKLAAFEKLSPDAISNFKQSYETASHSRTVDTTRINKMRKQAQTNAQGQKFVTQRVASALGRGAVTIGKATGRGLVSAVRAIRDSGKQIKLEYSQLPQDAAGKDKAKWLAARIGQEAAYRGAAATQAGQTAVKNAFDSGVQSAKDKVWDLVNRGIQALDLPDESKGNQPRDYSSGEFHI